MAKYKVGDKVRVKSWEEMEREYGKTDIGEINTRFVFTREMKVFCNKTVEIAKAYDDEYEIKEDNGVHCWIDEMFENVEKVFTKDNLKTGMLVETKNRGFYKVLKDYESKGYGIGILIDNKNGFMPLKYYDNNLKKINGNKVYEIVRIYKQKKDGFALSFNTKDHELLWERPAPKKMTLKEIEKELGYEIEIVGDE